MFSSEIMGGSTKYQQKYDCKIENEQESITQQSPKTNLYFHSILCNPYILENPADTTHKFMQDLLATKIIKKIQKMEDYISVDLREKKHCHILNLMENYHFRDQQLHNNLQHSYQTLAYVFAPNSQQETNQIPGESQKQFFQWMEKMKGKPVIGWFIPHCEVGFKLRNISVSKNMLNILNFKSEQFTFDLLNLGSQAFDVIDGSVFKTSFFTIINTIKKFDEMKNYGNISKADIVRESQTTLTCEMKGRGNRKLVVEMKIYMISENVLCYQVLRVLEQKEVKDYERMMTRRAILYKVEKSSYDSLLGVVKMPKVIDPSNTIKVCGYTELKHEGRPRRKVEDESKKL